MEMPIFNCTAFPNISKQDCYLIPEDSKSNEIYPGCYQKESELLQCAEALVGENKAKSTNSIGQLDKHMLLRECRECYTDEYGCHGGNLGAPD